MRDIVLPDIVVYFSMALALVGVVGTIFSNLIAEWLDEREQRKEAAAKAAAKAAAEAESAAKSG
ncbi:MAG: hypothetical protein OXU29_07040 [Gammaproteobacteria bacterium]|nr:hypothetical protein [Gammaproteobacteria bacterium]